MHKSKRFLILSAVIGGLGFIGFKVADYMWEHTLRHNPQALLELVPEAALQVKNFHRSNIEEGRKTWEIWGAEAGYFKAEEKAVIQRPKLRFFQESGEVISAVGRQGEVFLSDGELKKVVLTGAVEINYQTMTFMTDELVYLRERNHIISPGRIRATFDGIDLEGEGMELSISEERMKLQQKVKTTIRPELLRMDGITDGFSKKADFKGDRT